MRPIFRRVDPDAEEQDPTQEDQFNTDEVTLTENLVRESHQNSNDAPDGSSNPVRIRLAVFEPDSANAGFWRGLLSQLEPHLKSAGIEIAGIDYGMPRILTIEDFGTTGLTGSYESKDNSNFQDFWRRVGLSHKGGTKGGSWGLGKIVFPASSRIRTFFGLTVRYDDQNRTPLLMGQSVLKHHSVAGVEYAPIGLFAADESKQFRIPVVDSAFIAEFRKSARLTRTTEPGLSIAIPFVREEIKAENLLPHVVQNYFFPILTGRLEVEIAGEKITAATFDAMAAKHGGQNLSGGHLISFIRDIHSSKDSPPVLELPEAWTPQTLENVINGEQLALLREMFGAGKMIHVRAPVTLSPRRDPAQKGHFDLFIRAAAEGVPGQPLFIRDSITVPGESQFFPSRQSFAALVAADGLVSRFLRDAENPAHTRWNGNARRLNENWKSAGPRLSQIRHSLRALQDVLVQSVERVEQDALINILSVPDSGTDKKSRKPPIIVPPKIKIPAGPPKAFAVTQLKDGFAVRAGKGMATVQLPLEIKVQVAYNLLNGDPLKRHSPFDFDLTKAGDIVFTSDGATCTPTKTNELLIEATSQDFEVKVHGFDTNRDLKVRAKRQSQ